MLEKKSANKANGRYSAPPDAQRRSAIEQVKEGLEGTIARSVAFHSASDVRLLRCTVSDVTPEADCVKNTTAG